MSSDGGKSLELFNLAGRCALVSGGVRDLGLQISLALAEAGARVIVTSRTGRQWAQCGAKFAAAGCAPPQFLLMDVTDEASVVVAVENARKALGRIDILVNNAGGAETSAELATRGVEDWRKTIDVNLTGTFLVSQLVADVMTVQRSGKIINIASISGMLGRDQRMYEGLSMRSSPPDYQASKAAVINLTRDLAARLGQHGICVNCISPGGFERGQPAEFVRRYSERTMLGRMGRDGVDLKGAVVFLASSASDYVTGHNLVVDGGFTAW